MGEQSHLWFRVWLDDCLFAELVYLFGNGGLQAGAAGVDRLLSRPRIEFWEPHNYRGSVFIIICVTKT